MLRERTPSRPATTGWWHCLVGGGPHPPPLPPRPPPRPPTPGWCHCLVGGAPPPPRLHRGTLSRRAGEGRGDRVLLPDRRADSPAGRERDDCDASESS